MDRIAAGGEPLTLWLGPIDIAVEFGARERMTHDAGATVIDHE